MTNDASGAPEIRIINNAELDSHWQSVTDTDCPTLPTVYVSELKTLLSESITFGNCSRFRRAIYRELHVFQSPLDTRTYRVWVYLSGYRRSSSTEHAVLCSYHLTFAEDGATCRQRTASAADPIRNCAGITYSGHARQHNQGDVYTILSPEGPDRVVELEVPNSIPYAPLSPYSGALAYAVDGGTLVVLYFKLAVCPCYATDYSSHGEPWEPIFER